MCPLRAWDARVCAMITKGTPLAPLAVILLSLLPQAAHAEDPKPLRTLNGHHFEVYSLAFSPDGKTLASAGGYLSSDLKPGEILLSDVETGKLLRPLKGHTGGVWSVAFSPDGRTLASASADKTVKLWDAMTGTEQATLEGHTDWVRSVAFTPDGKTLASASNDQTVKLWDVSTRKERATLRGHTGGVACLAIAPDGKTLASNGFDNTIRVWDLATGQEVQRIPNTGPSYHMRFSPDGALLAHGGVGLLDTTTWQVRATLQSGTKPNTYYDVAFSPDGKTLAVAEWDKVVSLWDLTGQRERVLLRHGNVVLCVAFSPDGKLVASGNGATAPFEVKLWDVGGASGRPSEK
jgi:WD40 repeat protein